jgi:hypothetical protein
MRARHSLTGAVILLVLAVASCAESTTPAYSDIEGVYSLQIPEGTSVTLTPTPGSANSIDVTSAILDLNPVWRFSIGYSLDSGSGTSYSGTYDHTDAGVTLTYDVGGSRTAALSGGTLTLNTAGGQTLVFTKVQ